MATTNTLQLSDGRPEGATLGQSVTDLVALYGKTAIVQPAATAQSAVATTALATVASTTLTAADLTAINAVVARAGELTVLVNALRSAGVDLGTIKGSN